MPSPQLALSSPWFVALLFVLLAAAAAYALYRVTLPPVPFRLRLLLALLRGASLALMALLLLEPLLRLVRTAEQPAVLAVLADNSLSMRITDRLGSRADALRNALERVRDAAPAGADVRVYTFGLTLAEQPDDADSLTLDAPVTNLAEAVRALSGEWRRLPVAAAVLITDGVYTAGENPLYEAEKLGVPLFTVGVGDSTEQRDLVLSRIAANNTVYAGTEVPVDVTLKSSGFGGQRVDVVLAEGSRVLARTSLMLEEGTREYAVRLAYTPGEEGPRRYTVAATTLDGELTAANNRKSLFVRVLKGQIRLLILAGAPSPDLAILKQTLNEDRTVDARSFTASAGGGFYEGALTGASFDSADCIMLLGFPVASVSDQTMASLREAVARRTLPLL